MKGIQTRQHILESAMQLASVNGLENMSIGKLAEALGMSRSGVFAHFENKQALQIATLDAAWAVLQGFFSHRQKKGLARLEALLAGWLAYLENCPFAGGCVFMAASTEMDSQPSAVRDHLLALVGIAQGYLLEAIENAKSTFELRADVPSLQMAFELHAFLQAANNAYLLTQDKQYFALARQAMASRLELWRTI
jgi:AcrR family transcriptional regulator